MNIATFGPVDERSLEQLKRCMEAGDAEHRLRPLGVAMAGRGTYDPLLTGAALSTIRGRVQIAASTRDP